MLSDQGQVSESYLDHTFVTLDILFCIALLILKISRDDGAEVLLSVYRHTLVSILLIESVTDFPK